MRLPERWHRLRRRTRIIAAIVAVVVIAPIPAWAFWTSNNPVSVPTYTMGKLDIQLNGQDATAAVAFTPTGPMYPGATTAGTVTIKNNGTVPLSFWLTITGTAQTNGMADATNALATTGAVSSGTCAGTTVGTVAPVNTGADKVLAYGAGKAARQQLAASESLTLCVQLALDKSAANTVQNGSASFTITANGAQVGAP